jgi:hypothetical protein
MKSIKRGIKKTRVLVDYIVIDISTMDGRRCIISFFSQGYEMHGQPFAYGCPGIFVQAMVKYEDKIEAVISESEDYNEVSN